MRDLNDIRSGKPGSYPDQSVYAEYACAAFGLKFADIDGGTGLVFSVASPGKTLHFGAGRCCWPHIFLWMWRACGCAWSHTIEKIRGPKNCHRPRELREGYGAFWRLRRERNISRWRSTHDA